MGRQWSEKGWKRGKGRRGVGGGQHIPTKLHHKLINNHTPTGFISISKKEEEVGDANRPCTWPYSFLRLQFTSSCSDIMIRSHNICVQCYADDTQLYALFQPAKEVETLERLERCIEDLRGWMNRNRLKLNDSKTEFIIFGS